MLDGIATDFRLAARSLRKTPAFTAAAVVTLAIGIGANTAIFSLMDVVMLRPLNVRAPGELWQIGDRGPAQPGATEAGDGMSEILPWPLIERFRQALPRGASIAAMTQPSRFNVRLGHDDTTRLVVGQLVSGTFFSTFDVRPALGRLLTDDDVRAIDGEPVAAIGYGFWQRQFGGNPSVIGQTLPINGVPFTIVGVAPAQFRGVWLDDAVDIWIPLVMQNAIHYRQNASTHNARDDVPWPQQMNVFWLETVVRAPAEQRVVIERAFAPLHAAAMREVAADRPDAESHSIARLQLVVVSFARGYSDLRFRYSAALRLMMGMVTLLLLAACSNVANLLLARWAARQREVAVRLSLGAGRGRVIRQLVAESVLLGVLGAAAGLLVAQSASTTLATAAQVRDLLPATLAFDARVLTFCLLASVTTTLAFGLVPAVRASAASPATILAKGVSTTARDAATMRPLVAVQVAFSVVLVVGAALFARSLVNLRYLDPGYDREHLVQIRMDPLAGGLTRHQLNATYTAIARRAREIPGVVAAEVSRVGVASGRRSIGEVEVEGYQPSAGEIVRFMGNTVGPDYFATTGMAILAGRAFTEHDTSGQPLVGIVNETAARRYFGGIDRAIGRRVGFGRPQIEVVGVVRDAHVMSLREPPMAMLFLPLLQAPTDAQTYAQALDLRVTGDPATVGEAVRRAVVALEPRLLANGRPTIVAEALDRGLSRDRLLAGLAAAFGAIALLLACVGLYGVLSYAVARRRPEIGVRMAIGAAPRDVLQLVISEGLRLTAIGIAIGVVAAIAAARLVQSLLFDVSPSDPASYVMAVTTLLIVAGGASFLPARRASRVDPMTALRVE